MIIDCFTFYNEIKILELRLAELYNFVDWFVIVEANQTFTLKQKSLYYKDNIQLFKKYQNKIINIVIDLEDNNVWANEYKQRNAIIKGIDNLNLNNDDIIIISDADEIPDIHTIINHDINLIRNGYALSQDLYYYNLNNKINEQSLASIICSYKILKKYQTIQDIRNNFREFPVLNKGGWHFSYFGDINFIINKIQNYSHQEFNNQQIINPEHINYCINNNKDILNRDKENSIMYYIDIKDNKYLPKNYNLLIQNE